MAHRTDNIIDKLTDNDIKTLAEFFYLLWKCDERNKREGRYDKKNSAKKISHKKGD